MANGAIAINRPGQELAAGAQGGDWWSSNAPRAAQPGTPGTTAPGAPVTPPWGGAGGGWDDPNVITPSAKILQQAFAQGLTGQAAVDWATSHGAPNIAFYADKNQYGLPDGAYIAPNPQNPGKLDLISRSGGGGGFGGGGGGGAGFVGAPTPFQPAQFEAPTGLTFQNDPGYLERMRMGTDALQTAAAAKGSILGGGTLKALERYGQDYGTNEFGNVFGRALTTAGFNQQAGQLGYQNRYGQFSDYLNQLNQQQNRALQAGSQLYQRPPS